MSIHVLFVEPESTGHRVSLYAGPIVQYMISQGARVTFLTSAHGAKHPAFEVVEEAVGGGRVDVRELGVSPIHQSSNHVFLLAQQLKHWWALRRQYLSLVKSGSHYDLVYVNTLDYVDKAIALLGSPFGDTPLAGLLLSVKFHHAASGVNAPGLKLAGVFEMFLRLLLSHSKVVAVLTIDELLSQYVGNARGADKLQYVADPVRPITLLDRRSVRDELNIDDSQFVILIYGSLTARKGIRAALRLLTSAESPKSLTLVLAGQQDREVRGWLEDPQYISLQEAGRIKIIDSWITERKEEVLFSAADAVWVVYSGFYGPSGVMMQACAAGVPVICSEEGIVGWKAQQMRCGPIVSAADHVGVLHATARLASDPELCRQFSRAGQKALRNHNAVHFSRTVFEIAHAAAAKNLNGC